MNSRQAVILSLGFVVGALLPSSSGCVEANPDHCVNNGGDGYCAQQHSDWENAY
ncbi:hypothetical protein DB30_07961 [Enhygromyxa salina]|uniref:Lipoprotein n=1 Tax=Enhygromyxa salina TaxID=215803 RepID=A0A0C1ZRE1_9BACT|nr:hypothetical protein [Enhygromyxa salina]KIG13573.1 hypothetical protein DB30_07961 [Enhygromyxa salina]